MHFCVGDIILVFIESCRSVILMAFVYSSVFTNHGVYFAYLQSTHATVATEVLCSLFLYSGPRTHYAETARRFVSLNILLSLKITQGYSKCHP